MEYDIIDFWSEVLVAIKDGQDMSKRLLRGIMDTYFFLTLKLYSSSRSQQRYLKNFVMR